MSRHRSLLGGAAIAVMVALGVPSLTAMAGERPRHRRHNPPHPDRLTPLRLKPRSTSAPTPAEPIAPPAVPPTSDLAPTEPTTGDAVSGITPPTTRP